MVVWSALCARGTWRASRSPSTPTTGFIAQRTMTGKWWPLPSLQCEDQMNKTAYFGLHLSDEVDTCWQYSIRIRISKNVWKWPIEWELERVILTMKDEEAYFVFNKRICWAPDDRAKNLKLHFQAVLFCVRCLQEANSSEKRRNQGPKVKSTRKRVPSQLL